MTLCALIKKLKKVCREKREELIFAGLMSPHFGFGCVILAQHSWGMMAAFAVSYLALVWIFLFWDGWDYL